MSLLAFKTAFFFGSNRMSKGDDCLFGFLELERRLEVVEVVKDVGLFVEYVGVGGWKFAAG